MTKTMTLEEIVQLTKQLSLLDKVRLIEEIAPQIERELQAAQSVPRTPLGGLWKDLDITDEDIAEVRAEMWGNSPRIAGLNAGSIWMSDDFDEPLPDEFWTGKKAQPISV